MNIPAKLHRFVSFCLSFLLLFQSIAPAVVYAADETLILEATPTSTLTPIPSVANPPLAETPTETPIPSPEPTAEPTPELTPEVTPQPVLEITPEATPASIVTPTPKPFWVEVDGDTITTIDNVGEGVDYNFRGASVRFTKVTKPGKLTIRQVKLTPEQVTLTGALSDTAYDITSDMESGTFTYDLTLPLPQNNQNAKVEFASNADSLNQSQTVSQPEEKTENTITIRGLDHFTIFFVTSGIDQATNGSFCDDLINCNIDANLPSLEIVDSDYLEISSFVDEIPALWGNGDFSDDRYVQFNFSPGLDDDTSIYNSRLDIVYKTNEIDESFDFGAKLVVSDDDDFDEETDFVSLLTPDVSKPDEDQPFTIDLPGEYLETDTLNNLKARFYFFGDPLAEEAPGVITSFNQVVLDILSDETPPSDGSLIINDDDPYTKNRDVSLTISALDSLSDVAEMSLANLNSYHDWEPYLTTQSWTLPDTDGLKTVRAKFKDSAGNENESYLAFDTIILDRVAPSSSATSPEYDNDGIIPVSLTADDANGEATVSGVFQTSLWYRFNEGEWIDSEMTLPDTLGTFDFFPEDGDGAYEFYTIATDNAGNQESENYEEGDESVIPDSSTVFDTTAPVITVPADITAEATSSLGAIVTYTPPTATDTQDGSVAVSCDKNSGDTFSLGLTTVNCSSTDSAGNTASKTFKVTVSDTTIPMITLDGTTPIALEIHSSYSDAGATASDNIDGDLTTFITTVNPVNKDVLGSYVVTYDVSDSSGNPSAQITRTVNVVDTTAPATPSATPAAGDYATDQSATLSSSDEGSGLASIYYTTDGTTPDNTKTLYSTTITVNKDMTIKAIAYDNAGNASDILETVYGIAPKISAEASSSVTTTSTTITWITDDLATSRVIYDTVSHPGLGEVPNYGYANSTVEADAGPKVLSHSVTISGLTAGTTYYYRTVSHGSPEAVSDEHTLATPSSSGEGGNGGSGVSDGRSDGLGGQTPVCNNAKPGSAPTLFSALGGINNVTLKWTEAVDPLTYYLITYGAKPGAQTYGNPNVGGKGTTNYTVSGLSGGITYYFQVRAGNGCAPGDFSNEVSATTLGTAIAGETPAEGFSPEVRGASTDITPTETVTPSPEVLGESENNNNLPLWLILIFITSGGLVSWAFWRAR